MPALRGIDLDVPAGAFAAVLGPSGCGKTTLLRIVAGLERPDGGLVQVGDRVLDDHGVRLAPERRRIGLVPQEGALFPHLDVAGNVAYGLRRTSSASRTSRTSRSDRVARVDELLELVDLAGLGDRRPHELSGGQQQRVALARALAPRPDVVLLDEPFSALDASLRTSLREEVAAVLRRTGTTAVLVTHDQEEALSLAEVVAVMRGGAVVQAGTPTVLYRRPADIATARFLGDAVLLPGRRTDDDAVATALGPLALDPAAAHATGPEVTVLVRPEQVVPRPGGATGTVEQVRFHGPFADVTVRVGPTTLVARWPSTTLPPPGADVALAVDGPVVTFPPD